jgi:hypothetical protein
VKWFFIRDAQALDGVFSALRGGSRVSFYFSSFLRVESDSEEVRAAMFDAITTGGELVVGYPSASSVELGVAIVNGPSELTGILVAHQEGALVVWGEWPAPADDGEDAVTVHLVDADGELRPHPH